MPPVTAVPLILIGLLIAFLARAIFHHMISISGGAMAGLAVALALGFACSPSLYVLGGGLVGFLVGGVLAIIFLCFPVRGSWVLRVGGGVVLFPQIDIAIGVTSLACGFLVILIFLGALAIPPLFKAE